MMLSFYLVLCRSSSGWGGACKLFNAASLVCILPEVLEGCELTPALSGPVRSGIIAYIICGQVLASSPPLSCGLSLQLWVLVCAWARLASLSDLQTGRSGAGLGCRCVGVRVGGVQPPPFYCL